MSGGAIDRDKLVGAESGRQASSRRANIVDKLLFADSKLSSMRLNEAHLAKLSSIACNLSLDSIRRSYAKAIHLPPPPHHPAHPSSQVSHSVILIN